MAPGAIPRGRRWYIVDNTSVFQPDVTAEVIGLIEDQLEIRAKAGDVIGSVDGVPVKQGKVSSMVRYNGKELPERTRVFDKFGNPSEVPTAQLAHHLSKPRADSPGERAFFARPPVGKEQGYIEETCEWCLKRTGGAVRKKFVDIDDWHNHCQDKHPREYERKLKAEDREGVVTADQILKLLVGLPREQVMAAIGDTPRRGPGRPRKEVE